MTRPYLIPPSRRVELVEHVARTGTAMPTAWRRAKYWRQRVNHWRRLMLASGMGALQVEGEIIRFQRAVARESERQAAMAARDDEGGPAVTASAPTANVVGVRGDDGRPRLVGEAPRLGPFHPQNRSRGSGAAQYRSKNSSSVARFPILEPKIPYP